MSEDNPVDEIEITLDFTSEAAIDWRTCPEFYEESPLSPANDGSVEGFMPGFEFAGRGSYVNNLLQRYTSVLQTEFREFVDINEIPGWKSEQLSRIAEECIGMMEAEKLSSIRAMALRGATEQGLWGLKRYHYVEEEVGLRTVETIGIERIRALLDIRLDYQLDIASEQSIEDLTNALETQFDHEPILGQFHHQVGVEDRSVVRTLLVSHREEGLSQLAAETVKLIDEYRVDQGEHINRLRLVNTFNNLVREGDLPELLAVILGAREEQPKQVSRIKADIENAIAEAQQRTTITGPAQELTENTSLGRQQAEFLLQTIVPESATHTSTKPVPSSEEMPSAGRAADLDRHVTPEEIADLPEAAEREDDERQLFLIPVSSKTAFERFQRTVREMHPNIEKESNTVDGVWGASLSQKSAVDRMTAGDHVLFYRNGQYIYHARVFAARKDPETMAKIWPETQVNDGISEYPYLILLFAGDPVSIGSEEFNVQIGYTSSTPPAFWGVAPRRTRRITSVYDSLEAFINSFVGIP